MNKNFIAVFIAVLFGQIFAFVSNAIYYYRVYKKVKSLMKKTVPFVEKGYIRDRNIW